MNECPCIACQSHEPMPPLRADRRQLVIEILVGVLGLAVAVLFVVGLVIV